MIKRKGENGGPPACPKNDYWFVVALQCLELRCPHVGYWEDAKGLRIGLACGKQFVRGEVLP